MADRPLNKEAKDRSVRIPLKGGPSENLGYIHHHPGPARLGIRPDSSWTMFPDLGVYRLEGADPTTWKYVWHRREDLYP